MSNVSLKMSEFATLVKEHTRYERALEEIANRPTVELNPDGEDQAAHTMQLIAREALLLFSRSGSDR